MDQLSKIAHFLKLVVIIYQLVLMEAVPSCSRLFFFFYNPNFRDSIFMVSCF